MSTEESNNDQKQKENESQNDQPGMSIVDCENIITTPYERVLSIINEAKSFVKSNSATSNDNKKLIDGLEWVIKVITSHSLYAFELKETALINKISEQNPEFKEFVDFISKYNEEMIEMNKKNDLIGSTSVEVNNEYLKPSSILKRIQLPEKLSSDKELGDIIKTANGANNENKNGVANDEDKNCSPKGKVKSMDFDFLTSKKNAEKQNNNNTKDNKDKNILINNKSKNKFPKKIKNIDLIKKVKEFAVHNNYNSEKKQKPLTKNNTKKIEVKNSSDDNSPKGIAKTDNDLESSFNTPKKNIPRRFFSYVDIINSLFEKNFDPKRILTKDRKSVV